MCVWWPHGLVQDHIWLEAMMVWPKNKLDYTPQADPMHDFGHVTVAAILSLSSVIVMQMWKEHIPPCLLVLIEDGGSDDEASH